MCRISPTGGSESRARSPSSPRDGRVPSSRAWAKRCPPSPSPRRRLRHNIWWSRTTFDRPPGLTLPASRPSGRRPSTSSRHRRRRRLPCRATRTSARRAQAGSVGRARHPRRARPRPSSPSGQCPPECPSGTLCAWIRGDGAEGAGAVRSCRRSISHWRCCALSTVRRPPTDNNGVGGFRVRESGRNDEGGCSAACAQSGFACIN